MAPKQMSLSTGSRHVTKRSVKQMIKGELLAKSEQKVQTTATLATALSSAGLVITLTQQISQGDTLSQRTGNQISLLGVETRFTLVNTNVALSPVLFRVLLFQDTQNLGVLPAVTDILQTASYDSFYNLQEQYQQKRFKILDDYMYSSCVGGSNQAWVHEVKLRTARLNTQVTYQGTANANAANGRNAIFALIISSATLAGQAYDYNTLVRYTDL